MSWSLEIYAAGPARLALDALTSRLEIVAPSLAVASPDDASKWDKLLVLDKLDGSHLLTILAAPFDDECEADPELLFMLEREITDSDADDGDLDEGYTTRLKEMLRSSCWHYTISAARPDAPEQEIAVVRVAYAMTDMQDGLVHDLQSGAWMDSSLFEEMLDAYNAAAPF